MFKELRTLISSRPLTLTVVVLSGDRIRVCVIPQSLEGDHKKNDKVGHHKEVAKIPDVAIEALTTPLCLEGTAEELDAEMAEKLTKFSGAHGVLRGALDHAQEQIAHAVQEIEDRNKLKSKAKQVAPAGKDDKARNNKGANGQESTGNATPETPQSDTLPLEWLAPTSSSGTNKAAPETNTNPELITVREEAQ
jgi:PRTRC genetic system protein E